MLDKEFIHKANKATSQAGELLNRLSQDPEYRKPKTKGDGSPVTQADIEVSAFLVNELNSLGFLVVSEEQLPATPPGNDDSYFLVDPLDGTKYYARGEDEFAVCVGFVQKGYPTYGAIHDPTPNNLYWGAQGHGAFCNEQKIEHKGPAEKLVVYSSGFHKKPERQWLIDEMNMGDIREKGSALKFCDIAAGEVDLYVRFGPTSEWDTAAAQIILEEAGCILWEANNGERMKYGKEKYLNRGVIACHKSLGDKVYKVIEEKFWKQQTR
ncbi:MAG: 3'(2'),5'-bisphosphate nucleotidase CysQ [Bdellovibrionales bacterium]|nr:3'(2'),5'-bisphosphate nucleotidase CysQ [Bdellovibrionales bacterium]NQZ18423.1 3'(2'),5'-bisphosphate nucleotidase CysQ [Bdellovibrionales bacterium]